MKNVEIVKLIDNCVKIKFIGVYVRIFVQQENMQNLNLFFLGFLKFFILGSERSFFLFSNVDESFFFENLNFLRDDQNVSYNLDEIFIFDEEDEFKEIMVV